jgi:hypothetical protein
MNDRLADIQADLAADGDMSVTQRTMDARWLVAALVAERAENERLRLLLNEANEAFDDCTSDYSKELVADEPWRSARAGLT